MFVAHTLVCAPLLHPLVATPSVCGVWGGRACQETDTQGEEDSEEEQKEQDEETEPSDDDDEDAVGWKVGGWDIARHGKGRPLRLLLWRVARRLAFPPSSGRRRTSPTGTATAAAATRATSAATTPRMGGRESGDK